MSDSMSGFDFTGGIFGDPYMDFGGFDPSQFQPDAFGQSGGFGQSGPFLGGTMAQPVGSDGTPPAPAPDPSATPAPDAATPPLSDRINAWLNKNVLDLGGAGSAGGPGLSDRVNTWLNKNVLDLGGTPAAGTAASGTAGAAGGSGQGGAFANKLKTALTGLQNVAKGPDQAKDGQPGSAWPFGRPQAAAVAPTQSRGTAVPGLANMIQLLQQRRQQFLQQGGRMPSGAPGGGLLGM
jgi:hypothetical protein